MIDNWYKLKEADLEQDGEIIELMVLVTSPNGLNTLTTELESIAKLKQNGRYELRIDTSGNDEPALFTHIDVTTDMPQEIDDEVLYISQEGLDSLIVECKAISDIKRLGRFELRSNPLESGLKVLFTHIELTNDIPDDSSSSSGCQIFIWFFLIGFIILGLAFYGLVSLVKDFLI